MFGGASITILFTYLVSLVVVLLKLTLSSAADAGLIRERGLSLFSDTDLHTARSARNETKYKLMYNI